MTMSQFQRTEITFEHHGKSYSLYTRGESPIFYLRMMRRGRQITRSLGTGNKAAALVTARKKLTELARTDWVPEVKVAAPTVKEYATIAELTRAFRSAKRGVSSVTVNDYCNALEKVLRVATGAADAATLSSTLLTEATVDSFIEKSRAEGRPDHSIKSTLTQARCVVSLKVMTIYRDLTLPDLTGFRCAREFSVDRGAGFRDFTRQEVIDLERVASEVLAKKDPVWIVYILMSRLGLRNGEVERAKWSDIVEGVEFVDGAAVPQRYFVVRARYVEAQSARITISDDIYRNLLTYRIEDQEEIVPAATKTARHDICTRRVNEVFAPYITGRRKVSYELRRWAGSRVYTRHGSDAARNFLRHATVTTTERYYAKDLRGVASASADDLREFYGIG